MLLFVCEREGLVVYVVSWAFFCKTLFLIFDAHAIVCAIR